MEDIFEKAHRWNMKRKYKDYIEKCQEEGTYTSIFKNKVYCNMSIPGWCDEMVPCRGDHGWDWYCGRHRNGEKL